MAAFNADAEGRAQVVPLVARVVGRRGLKALGVGTQVVRLRIGADALKHRALGVCSKRRGLRANPALDRELAEYVGGGCHPARRRVRRMGRLVGNRKRRRAIHGTREVERLAQGRVGEELRVGLAANGLGDFLAVGYAVVVRIVAFVHLEGEHVVVLFQIRRPGDGVGRKRPHCTENALAIVLSRIAVRICRIGHPQRRRIGVGRLRIRRIDLNHLLVVAETVAIGVG